MSRQFFMTKLTLASAVALSVMLAACGDKDEHGGVAAIVNGSKIYAEDIAGPFATIPAQLLQGREDEIRKQILEQLIQRELIRQEAKRIKLDDNKEFQKQLENARDQLVNNFVLKQKLDETLTDEALRQTYEATKQTRAYPATKARHILVKTEAEAKDLLKVVTPQNFADMAKEKSVGPSAPAGGDLGWFRKEAMIPAFSEVAFGTQRGTIAKDPVQTQFGWHVIYVEDKNDVYVPSFEQVQEQLRAELGHTVVQGYLKELREKAVVSIKEQEKEDSHEEDDKEHKEHQ
ncbi:MAG: peptidylprolyl isomerase [Alphaproteobacteria bacterium]|nr:peptidylprolyl isomerase [Alphaproteobacteria bacterium]MDD9919536.1 peptidylprolyl isomerase [Alphaproteobacteria bacterium]